VDYRTTQHRDATYARRVMLELFSRGVFLNPMGPKLYLSLTHDEAACGEFCNRFFDSLVAAEKWG
jgi:glutamate-1-semialdehyde 2,1-aminomutase